MRARCAKTLLSYTVAIGVGAQGCFDFGPEALGTGGAPSTGGSLGGGSPSGGDGGTGGPDAATGATGGVGGTDGGAGSGCTVYFTEDFSDNSNGWTLQGEWEIGPTSASTAHQKGSPDPALDHSTTSDNGVAGIKIGGNYVSPVHPADYLTSPVLNLSNASGMVVLSFWRVLNCDWAPYVTETVEVYDGSSWVVLWTNASLGNVLITEDSWTRYEYDVTAHKNANFRVRFSHATGKNGNFLAWIMSGWNVDDVAVSSAGCK